MTWRFDENLPIYTQIISQIKQMITSGRYQPGEKLPSVRDMAQEAGVNPNTMQRALSELEREGLLYTVRTSGRFVTVDQQLIEQIRQNQAQERIRELLRQLLLLGFSREQILALVEHTLQSMMEEQDDDKSITGI